MSKNLSILAAAVCFLWACEARSEDNPVKKAPLVKHQPVPVAVQGQSMSIKASVADDSTLKSVILNYSTSKDVAPFKLEMQSVGDNVFVCTIPANLLTKAAQVTYFIEATDNKNLTTETPWYTVSIQAPQPGSGSAAKVPSEPVEKKSSWVKPALITGGILLVGGVAAAIAANSGDDGSPATPAPVDNTDTNASPTAGELYQGRYEGSVDLYFKAGSVTRMNMSGPCTIDIDSDGRVSSSDLYDSMPLSSTISYSGFTLTANVNDTNYVGTINFAGLFNGSGSISGSINGSGTDPNGTNLTCSGSFSATK